MSTPPDTCAALDADPDADPWPTEVAEKVSEDAWIAQVLEKYNAGVPFFTKEMIRHAQQQISQFPLPRTAPIMGYDGKLYSRRPYCSDYYEGVLFRPAISFRSIESLTIRCPVVPLEQAFCSISLSGVSHASRYQGPDVSQDMVSDAFEAALELWETSTTFELVKQHITPHLAGLSGVDKIVGFGLGRITWIACVDQDLGRQSGPCTQHALMITLARFLESRTGNKIACFAQDPAYGESCKAVLNGKGIEVVKGENGFLIVNDNSVVLSFSPNIPVRQVIADLCRPAIMVWDRIVEKERSTEWNRGEDGLFESPYTTDPASPRVVAMANDYVETPFDDEFIRRGGLYVRKSAPS